MVHQILSISKVLAHLPVGPVGPSGVYAFHLFISLCLEDLIKKNRIKIGWPDYRGGKQNIISLKSPDQISKFILTSFLDLLFYYNLSLMLI